jgi:hypothetical protein
MESEAVQVSLGDGEEKEVGEEEEACKDMDRM